MSKTNRTIIRPSAVYWIIDLGCIAVGVLMYWGLGQARPSDNPQFDRVIHLLVLIIPMIIGLISLLYAATKRITIDEDGVSSGLFLSRRKLYKWNEITSAHIISEAMAYPCMVYAGERLIAKVPRAFIGYESLLRELEKRKIICEDDLYEAAMGMVTLDRIKLRDFFKKD